MCLCLCLVLVGGAPCGLTCPNGRSALCIRLVIHHAIHPHPNQTEYGGACEVPLGESPFEKQLLEIVETGLEEHEMTWLDKDPPLPAQQSQRAAAGAATIGAMAEAGEEDEE